MSDGKRKPYRAESRKKISVPLVQKPTKKTQKRIAKRENKQLQNIAKEPFMTDTRSWNEALEKPPEIPKPPTRRTTNDTIQLTPERRRFLFMHLSDSSIMALVAEANRVYFEGLPVQGHHQGNVLRPR